MAQNRYHDYYAEATTLDLNEHFDQVQRKCKVEGMEVTASGNWQVTIGPGKWFRDGVVIEETSAIATPLAISAASEQDRWDVVYGQYTYQAVSPPPEATYGVKQGTPGANPVIPSLEDDQVALAYIYIPSTANTLADCTIHQAYGLKEQIEMLLHIKVEGNIWVRADDPQVSGEWVEDGDFWLDTDDQTLYVWDASSQTWVPPTIPAHAPTHHATGNDPLDVKDLADSLKFLRNGSYSHYATKEAHDALAIDHGSLSNVQPDQHHARDHAWRHMDDGEDPLPWHHGGGTDADMVDGYHASQFALVNHDHPDYAPCPHGNECHTPDFAPDDHTHPLADIDGTISIGWVSVTTLAFMDIPVGSNFFEYYVPNIDIPGTTVKITDLIVRVAETPSTNITFAFKVNDNVIGQVTVPSQSNIGQQTLSPPVTLSSGQILSIDGPADPAGAKGLDAKFRIIRQRA